MCCHLNTGPGVLGTGKQKDRDVEADNSSGRVYATCMYQTVFGQSCISPVGANSRHGVELLLARSCGPECGSSEPTRRAAGTQPAGRCGRRRPGWILSMKGLRRDAYRGRQWGGLNHSCSVHKLPWDSPGTPVLQRVPLSSVHRQPRLWSCAGPGRGSGSVGGLSGRNAGDPASDVLHNPWLISPPINGFEESRLGCDMGSLESSCFFELCGAHTKAHAQASEDRRMACKRCDLLRPERLSQKQVQRRRKEADASSTLRSR